MDIESWKSQLRKGAAEFAVLSLLAGKPLSGIGLLEKLKPHPEVGLSDGTLYPLLKRLERDGRVTGEWQLSQDGGRPTKRYTLTKGGKAALQQMKKVWVEFCADLSIIVGAKK